MSDALHKTTSNGTEKNNVEQILISAQENQQALQRVYDEVLELRKGIDSDANNIRQKIESTNNYGNDIEQLLGSARNGQQEIQLIHDKAVEIQKDLVTEIENIKSTANSKVNSFANDAEKLYQTKAQEAGQAVDELKANISAKGEFVEELKTSFNDKVTKYTTTVELKNQTLDIEQTKLSERIDQLSTIYNNCLEISKKISTVKEDAEKLKESVEGDIASIKQSNVEFNTLLTESKTLQEEVSKKHAQLQELLKSSTTLHKAISSLHTQLLTGEQDADGKIINTSLKDNINALYAEQKDKDSEINDVLLKAQERIKQFIADNTKECKALKQVLEAEIRELLPGAGAAGLSSAYVQAKSRYGHKEYDKKPISSTPWQWVNYTLGQCDKFFHHITGNFSTIVYYLLFLGPLVFMFYHIADMFKNVQHIDVGLLVFKFLLGLPLGLVSLFGFSSIRLNRRLYEEYNHKQRVMQLYHSFKEEIEQNGSEEHKAALITMMIAAVQDKPSVAMQKYDQSVEDLYKNWLSNTLFPQKNELPEPD